MKKFYNPGKAYKGSRDATRAKRKQARANKSARQQFEAGNARLYGERA